MGLKYVSSDSSNLMTALEQNIMQIKSEMDTLSTGANQLVLAVDGRTLSGAAYTAASGLFSECIIPAIQKTKSAVDAIQTDLSSYKTQDGTVSGEGVLDEDELNKQLTSLKNQKKSAEQMSSYLSTQVTNLSQQKGTDYSSYIGQLNSSITSLSSTISSLGSDIAEVERKLKLLQNFSANTSGLFSGAKDGLSVSMQAVMMLSQVTINSDGSYSFPAGDASWFTTKQKDVNNSLVYALYTMPEAKDGKDAEDIIVKLIEKYGPGVVKILLDPNTTDYVNTGLKTLQKYLHVKGSKIFINGVALTIDATGRLKLGSRFLYKPSNGHKYTLTKGMEAKVGNGFDISDFYDDLVKNASMPRGARVWSAFKSEFSSSFNILDDFKGIWKSSTWKNLSKWGKAGKGFGIASTVFMFGQNISNNFDKNGNFDAVGMASDTLVDVTLNAGAAAGGSAIGAAIGTALFPGVGTAIGYLAGAGISFAMNWEFGKPPQSVAGHVKSGVKKFVKDPVGAINGAIKWAFGG